MVNASAAEPVRIVVVVKGGAVEGVLSNTKGIEVLVKDLDVEGSCDATADPSGRPCNYGEPDVSVRAKRVAAEFSRRGPA